MADKPKNAADRALEKLGAQDAKPPLTPEVVDGETSMIVSEFGTAEIAVGHFVSKIGLNLPDDLSIHDWAEIASGLNTYHGASMWIVGDWLNFGEDHYGQEFAQFVDRLQYAQVTQLEALRISRRFPKESRHPNLEWRFHQTVAALPAAEREALLCEAEIHHWTSDQLRDQVRERQQREKAEPKTRKAKPKKVQKKGMTPVEVMAYIEQKFEPELKEGAKAAAQFFKAVDHIKDKIQEEGVGITQKQAEAFADTCRQAGVAIGTLEAMARQIASFEIREEEPPKAAKAKKPKAAKTVKAKKTAAAEIHESSAPSIDKLQAQIEGKSVAEIAAHAETAKPEPKKARRKSEAGAEAHA